jgi:hypothetical protein
MWFTHKMILLGALSAVTTTYKCTCHGGKTGV